MADFSICTSRACRAETPGIVDKCPTCGSRVQTSRKIRLLGWLSIACGVFLIGLMGWITLALYPTLSSPGLADPDGGRWAGTAEQARMALNLFYLVIGFGVLAAAAGVWMVVTGRRHIAITVVTLLFADRGLHIPTDALRFMTERLERDYWAAERAVEAVDRFAIAERARLSLPTIRRALLEAKLIGSGD